MVTLFLQFLIAHFLGDFVFQPEKWVKDKEKKKLKSDKLYYHIAVHSLFLLLFLAFNLQKYWVGFLLVISSHFLIDIGKLYIQRKKTKRYLFFIDQLLHIIMIAITVNIYHPFTIDTSLIFTKTTLLFIACTLFVTFTSSIIMNVLLSYWNVKDITNDKLSLKNAGKYIGFLERLFVFLFIILGRWEGVGLLLGAKSVFRFGDLNDAKDRKLTEYVLIGTLLSFGLAIVTGLVYLNYGR